MTHVTVVADKEIKSTTIKIEEATGRGRKLESDDDNFPQKMIEIIDL